MKKIILFVIGVLIAGYAYAYPDAVTSYQISGSNTITTTRTRVFGLQVNYKAVTAGDTLELKNGASSTGTTVYTFYAPAVNGSFAYVPSVAMDVDGGIYQKTTVTSGGFTTDILYQ